MAAEAAPAAAGVDRVRHHDRLGRRAGALHALVQVARVGGLRRAPPARPRRGQAGARARRQAHQRQCACRPVAEIRARRRRAALGLRPGRRAREAGRRGARRDRPARRSAAARGRATRRGARLRRLPAGSRAARAAVPAPRASLARAGVEYGRWASARHGRGREDRRVAAQCRGLGSGVARAARRRKLGPVPALHRPRQARGDRGDERGRALRQ